MTNVLPACNSRSKGKETKERRKSYSSYKGQRRSSKKRETLRQAEQATTPTSEIERGGSQQNVEASMTRRKSSSAKVVDKKVHFDQKRHSAPVVSCR